MALGELLTGLLEEVEGIEPAATTPGSEHGFWAYPVRTGELDGVAFGRALQAEGVPNMPGYIGKPIYMCTEALTAKKTYGDSRFPFDRERACGRPWARSPPRLARGS